MRQDDILVKNIVKAVCIAEVTEIQEKVGFTEKYTLSAEFRRKIQNLIIYSEKRERRKSFYKIAMIIAACFIVMYTLCRPNYIVSAYENFIQWFEKYVVFSGVYKNEEVIPKYYLSYVPENYNVEVQEGYYGSFGYADIESRIFFSYRRSDGVINVTNKETTMLTVTAEDGTNIIYLKSDNEVYPNSIVWYSEDGTTIFSITGCISIEELLKCIME